jgi:hypothetical protein
VKSGTSSGLSTGGGFLGEAKGYTPGIGGPEEGDGNGAKVYKLMGIGVGNGWVRTAGPLVGELTGLKTGGDEVTLPGKDELAGLGVGTEEEYGESENDGEEEAGKGGEDDGTEGVGGGNNGTEDGGKDDERGGGEVEAEEEAAKVCPAPSRTRKTECRMDLQSICTSQGELGEGGGS